jgi:hypothetical protein
MRSNAVPAAVEHSKILVSKTTREEAVNSVAAVDRPETTGWIRR